MEFLGNIIGELWSLLGSISAAAALAIFAGVQVLLVLRRGHVERVSLKDQTVAPAWLARRSLEDDARNIVRHGFPHVAKVSWRNKDRVDRIEAQMREVLRLSAGVGGKFKDRGREAFKMFIGLADGMNVWGQGQPTYSEEEVVERLYSAMDALGEIHPRGESEPDVPEIEAVRRRLIGDGHTVKSD